MEEPALNTVQSAARETEGKKKRRVLLALLLLLLFLLLTTSCIVGFLLGRTTDPGRFGALIDTIVLAPGVEQQFPRPSPGDLSGQVSLLGVVRYTNAVPYTQGTVRLQSEPRYSGLSGEGRFRFDEVETGDHELTVLDPSGKELARRSIRVERDAGDRSSYIEFEQDVCVMHIKALTVEVDVELILEDDPGKELDVRLIGTREEEETVPVFQPSLAPTVEAAATPGAGADDPPPATPAAPGVTPGPTETAIPSVRPTAGTEPMASPGASPAVTASPGATASPAPSGGVEPTRSPSPAPTAGVEPTVSPDPSPTPSVSPTPDTDPTPRPPVRPTPTPTPTQAVEVYDNETGKTWTQLAGIDLFRPLGSTDDRNLIAPGSKGYYLFRLENGRNGAVRFTLSIREKTFHVPLVYRLVDDMTGEVLLEWQPASPEAVVSLPRELDREEENRCRIEWEWPPDGDDAVDTALGQLADRTYILELTIRAEDVA